MPGARRGYLEMKSLAEKIAENNIRVLLHDRRNTGKSDLLIDDLETEEITWSRELNKLLKLLNEKYIFISGSSSGARTSLMYALEFPSDLIGMIIMRVTGGEFAAKRLPVNYYEVFIEAAKSGGMEAVCETKRFMEYIKTNPAVKKQLIGMDVKEFIKIQSSLLSKFLAGAELPVMGITEWELNSIKTPSLVIPGNDNTHNSKSGIIAYNMLGDSSLHQLPIDDVDVDLIPWEDWLPYEDEIADEMSDFINKIMKDI
jgi:pimeloyl-ACP methyl ester carboxylesterase